MMLFRSIELSDLDAVHNLALQAGVGITTLPKEKEQLAKRIEWSIQSFTKKDNFPSDEYYLFVLEDLSNKTIVGTSAIESFLGTTTPFYSYKISHHTQICHPLSIRYDYQLLNLVNDLQGKSELCTLFLLPDYRVNGNGQLLSRARFLFMRHFKERFATTIIAEMRGISNEEGESPLWQNIGEQFFKISFQEADRLTITTNKQFIADLMPKDPIHIQLLNKAAQKAIGKPHPRTVPAMKILLSEGFCFKGYVDIFDGGPALEAELNNINTVQHSSIFTVKKLVDSIKNSKSYLIANTNLSYRAVMRSISFDNECCELTWETAAALNVIPGDKIYAAAL